MPAVPRTAATNPQALPGTAFGRGLSQRTVQEHRSSGALWWKKEWTQDVKQRPVPFLVEKIGKPSQFEGSLTDAISAVKQLNKDEGFRNLGPLYGEGGGGKGYWSGGDDVPLNNARAILQGATPSQWVVQPVGVTSARGTAVLDVDPERGTGRPYTRTVKVHDLPAKTVALVDQERHVDVRDGAASWQTTGREWVPAAWNLYAHRRTAAML